MSAWFSITLWKRILLALVAGAIVGAIWGEGAASIGWIGDLFMRLIRMVVVPLIFTTLVVGVVAMGDPKKLGSIGIKTMALYMGTTAIALIIGMTLATIVQPGIGVDVLSGDPKALSQSRTIGDQLMAIVPTNPVAALAKGEVLAIIFFAIITGIAIMMTGQPAKPVENFMEGAAQVVLKITHMVMEVAPFGVFALIARVTGTQGISALLDVLPLAGTIIVGCLLHIIIVHGAIMQFVLRLPAVQFFKGIIDAQMVAFSSSSSSGTLPVTMSVAKDNLGVSQSVASSVLPLGSTINMDGTAVYVGIVAIFSAQALGILLGITDYLLLALTVTLVSIGTAGIPSASLFLLAAVLGTINIDDATTALIVGFLFPFDRPLDMLRTVVNVTGDLSVATAVAKWEQDLDEETFRADPVE